MFNLGSTGSGNRIKLDKSGYLKVGIGTLVVFGLIVLYVFELRHFDLLINPARLILLAFALGLILGIMLGNRFSRGVQDTFEKFRIYIILIFLSIVFMPLMVNLANRLLDFREGELREVSLESAEPYISEKYGVLKGEEVKIAGYKIVIVMDQEVYQLKSRQHPFPENKPGDKVNITIHQGLFGLKYLDLFNN